MIPFKTIPLRPVSKLTSCSTVLTTKRTRFLNAQSNGFKVQLTTSQKLACTVCGKIIPLIAKIKTKLIRKVEIRGKYFFIFSISPQPLSLRIPSSYNIVTKTVSCRMRSMSDLSRPQVEFCYWVVIESANNAVIWWRGEVFGHSKRTSQPESGAPREHVPICIYEYHTAARHNSRESRRCASS